MRLIDIGSHHCFTNFKAPRIGSFHALNQAEEGGFTGPIGSNYPHNAVGWQHEVEVVKQQLIAKTLFHADRFNYFVPETGTIRNKEFQLFFPFFLILVQKLFVGVQTSLPFGLTRLRGQVNPLQLPLQCLAAFADLFLFLFHPFCLLFQPGGVVPFPGYSFATIEFQYPASYMIEEVTVVRDTDYRSLILLQMLLQPVDGFSIEVVGRLIEQQHIGLLQEQPA